MYKKGITFFILFSLSHFAFAQDITGIWQSVDDQRWFHMFEQLKAYL